MGLLSIEERVKILKGTFSIKDNDGQGIKFMITILANTNENTRS